VSGNDFRRGVYDLGERGAWAGKAATPAPAQPSTAGSAAIPQAPTGHRQPRMSDLPPDVSEQQRFAEQPSSTEQSRANRGAASIRSSGFAAVVERCRRCSRAGDAATQRLPQDSHRAFRAESAENRSASPLRGSCATALARHQLARESCGSAIGRDFVMHEFLNR
jgi:hypothetical protein